MKASLTAFLVVLHLACVAAEWPVRGTAPIINKIELSMRLGDLYGNTTLRIDTTYTKDGESAPPSYAAKHTVSGIVITREKGEKIIIGAEQLSWVEDPDIARTEVLFEDGGETKPSSELPFGGDYEVKQLVINIPYKSVTNFGRCFATIRITPKKTEVLKMRIDDDNKTFVYPAKE